MVTTLAGPGAVAGGVWEVVVNQARALRNSGHEVRVVAGWLGAEPPGQLRGLDVALVPVRSPFPGLGLRALVGRQWHDAVRREVTGCHVAHVHLCRDLLTTRATGTIQRLRVPIIAQTHGMLRMSSSSTFRAFDRFLTRPALARVNGFISLTSAERPDLVGMGVAEDRITTIHNAAAESNAKWCRPEKPTFLFVSRLHARKQPLAFAQSIAALRERGYDVGGRIAGPDHGELPRLREFVHSSQHGDHIQYLGTLDREQLDDELSRATAFVFPAKDEPFGLVIAEALAVGTPTICTSETPLAGELERSDAALITAPEVGQLTAHMAQLLDQPELQDTLSRQGHALYRRHWTETAMVDKLQLVYRQALAEAPA